MSENAEVRFLEVGQQRLAYRRRDGASPTLVFFPGYASDMEGTKAVALDDFARSRGLAMVRFDYSGTGSSSGGFEDGTLATWIEESLAIIDLLTDGPLLLVGSSMGGWIALHLGLRRAERVQALVGIAAAPDFTAWGFSDEQKAEIQSAGRIGAEMQLITRDFWESGQQLRLLDATIAIDCPVRLVHGELDQDVPLEIAFRLMRALHSADVQLQVIKGGGHRLSEPHEIDTVLRTVAVLTES